MAPRLSPQKSWAAGAGSPFWRRTRHPCDQHGAASWCIPCFVSPRARATGSISFDCASIALARRSAASSSPTAGTPTAAAARWCKTGRGGDWPWTCGERSGAWRLVKPVERATTTQCSMRPENSAPGGKVASHRKTTNGRSVYEGDPDFYLISQEPSLCVCRSRRRPALTREGAEDDTSHIASTQANAPASPAVPRAPSLANPRARARAPPYHRGFPALPTRPPLSRPQKSNHRQPWPRRLRRSPSRLRSTS